MRSLLYLDIGLLLCVILLSIYIYVRYRRKNKIEPFEMNLNMLSTQIDYSLVNYFILSSYNSCIESISVDGTSTLSLDALTNTLSNGFRFIDFELYASNDHKSIPIVASSNTTESSDGNVPEPIINTTTPLPFMTVMNHIIYNAFRPGICSNYTDPVIVHLRFKTYDSTIYNKIANILKTHQNWLLPPTYSYKSLMSKTTNETTHTVLNTPLSSFKNKIIIFLSSVNDEYLNTNITKYINNIPFNPGITKTPIIQITPIDKLTITEQLINFNKFNLSIIIPNKTGKTNTDINTLNITENNNNTINSLNNLGIQCVCVMQYKNDENYKKYIKWFNEHTGAYILKDVSLREDPVVFIPKPQDPKLSFKPVTFKVSGINQNLDI